MKPKRKHPGVKREDLPTLREDRYAHRLWTLERILIEVGVSKAVTRTVLNRYGIAGTRLSQEPPHEGI